MICTTCPYCGVGCGVRASYKNGVTTIEGDKEHPANFGRLCSKGSALGETTGPEDRLLYPQIGDERTSWDEALNLVAAKFNQTVDEHGPDSVAFYVSGQILTEDYYVANKLMKGAIGSANIDTNSRLCMASSVVGHKRAFGTDTVPGTYDDLELADLLILVGSNLAWCHPVIYQRVAAAKQVRPDMKVVVIDPRRTATCELADLHLTITPDGDTALFNKLLVALHKRGVTDTQWMTTATEGFAAALEAAQADTGETGLAPDEEAIFFDWVCNTEKTVTVYSQGVNQSRGGTDKVNAILNCHLSTGRIGRPGMGPFSITGQPNAMGGREVGGLANQLAAHMDFALEDVDRVARFWDTPGIAKKPGLKAIDMFQAVAGGRVKAIWIMGTNPVDSLPEANSVAKALAACPFVVVSDVVNETDTLAYADVVLPAAAWGEKDGTVTNSERRISRQRPFMAAPGDAKPDWWQICQVAHRMGCAGFDYETPAQIFAEHARLSAFENNGTRDFDIGAWANTDETRYNAMTPFRWPARTDGETAERFFADGRFYTPSGRGRFVAVSSPAAKTVDPAFPMTLNTGRIRDHWHTMTRTARSPRLSAHIAEPYCEIHPADAARLGIKEATLVRIASPKGEAVIRALITDRQMQGHVFAPMHWTSVTSSAGRIDTVVPAITDPFSGQPASKNVAVTVTALSPAAYGFAVMQERPDPQSEDLLYWALAKCDGGWRMEFALSEGQSFAPPQAPDVSVNDGAGGRRDLWFDGDRLKAAIFTSPRPVAVARSWAVEQLSVNHNPQTRSFLGAGRPGAGQPDKGAIVCSCNSVGANEIGAAIHAGCTTIDAVGTATQAGTNCGSCRSEIATMISQFTNSEEGGAHVAPLAAE
ncbi:MAG: molybdopterin-dependent oxidoreductase [Pseudomonadota bacterium]